MPPLRNDQEIIRHAIALSGQFGPVMVAVPAAADDDVIGAVKGATDAGFARATLLGDEKKIRQYCDELKVDMTKVEVRDMSDDEAAKTACQMASEAKAGVIMKGNMPTGKLLKTVLAKEFGLRRGRTLSHIAVLSIPGFTRLVGITDGGMIIAPDEVSRPQIVENAVEVFRALGIDCPKVAMLAGTDQIVPATKDLAIFAKAASRGLIPDAIVDGPMSLDAALWEAVSDRLGYVSPVAGAADIIVVGGFEAGNIIVKSLDLLADAVFAGVIAGAKVPVAFG